MVWHGHQRQAKILARYNQAAAWAHTFATRYIQAAAGGAQSISKSSHTISHASRGNTKQPQST